MPEDRGGYKNLPICGASNVIIIRLASLSGRIRKAACAFTTTPLEGVVNIPDEAPPRPGAGAEWNVLSGKWGSVEL